MVVRSESAEVKRVGRDRGEHRARPFAGLYLERVAIAAAAQLEFLPATHEVVIGRIEREQHADSALRISVQDDEVAVLRGLDVDTRAVAGVKLIVVEANRDWILNEQQQG